MIRNNKWKVILSSVIILLPMLIGIIFWSKLPEQMTTHWGADGNADGWSNRAFAVFGLPLILLATHWICIFITARDPKNNNQNKKVFGMILWIAPILSFFTSYLTYATSLGRVDNVEMVTFLLMGLLFVVIGNYLPKCKQNYTIGIKLKWTLANEENWNATHRLGGKVWVVGGLVLMLCIFLPVTIIPWALILIISLMIGIPMIYSYCYYKRQVAEGRAPEKVVVPMDKWTKRVSLAITSIVIVFVGVMCFTGNIEIRYDETSFTLEASYWGDLTVEYEEIDSIEYLENSNAGVRVNGFGSPRLSMGAFKNDDFGNYTRYSYTQCEACVVLRIGEDILVISGKDAESTTEIYERLLNQL